MIYASADTVQAVSDNPAIIQRIRFQEPLSRFEGSWMKNASNNFCIPPAHINAANKPREPLCLKMNYMETVPFLSPTWHTAHFICINFDPLNPIFSNHICMSKGIYIDLRDAKYISMLWEIYNQQNSAHQDVVPTLAQCPDDCVDGESHQCVI